jgi:hypothetical protein
MCCLFAAKTKGPGWRRGTTLRRSSGGLRSALNKELGKARTMTNILAAQSAEVRAKAETLLQQADRCGACCGRMPLTFRRPPI